MISISSVNILNKNQNSVVSVSQTHLLSDIIFPSDFIMDFPFQEWFT